MAGKRSSAPVKMRLAAIRVVSNGYSSMKPGYGSGMPRLRGMNGRMGVDHRPMGIERRQDRIERRVAEIDPVVIGEQADALELQDIERIIDLRDRILRRPHRNGGKTAEAVRPARLLLGRMLVEPAGQRLAGRGLAELHARHRHRHDRIVDAVGIHHLERGLRRARRIAAAAGGPEAGRDDRLLVEQRNGVEMNVDSAGRHDVPSGLRRDIEYSHRVSRTGIRDRAVRPPSRSAPVAREALRDQIGTMQMIMDGCNRAGLEPANHADEIGSGGRAREETGRRQA